jgi:hypothetical protein
MITVRHPVRYPVRPRSKTLIKKDLFKSKHPVFLTRQDIYRQIQQHENQQTACYIDSFHYCTLLLNQIILRSLAESGCKLPAPDAMSTKAIAVISLKKGLNNFMLQWFLQDASHAHILIFILPGDVSVIRYSLQISQHPKDLLNLSPLR